MLKKGLVKPIVEPPVPKVPMDYTWAKRLGLVRKPANFISSISDDRGDELRSVLILTIVVVNHCTVTITRGNVNCLVKKYKSII